MTTRSIPSTRHIRARLRIRHLELLLALEEVRSLHKASARMNMTQPAASKLLLEIEAMFGVPLFVRSHRGVVPTEYGGALLQKAALLLADLDSARDEIESMTRGASGRLRVGLMQVSLPLLLPVAFKRLRTESPRISLRLHEGASGALLAAVARGELDCVVGRIDHDSSVGGIAWERLYEEPVCVAARVGHPLARRQRVTAAMLAQHEWILPTRGAPLRQEIENYFRAQRVTPPVPVVESVSVIANAVLMRDTDLVAMLPLGVARYYAEIGQLAILRFRPEWVLPAVGLAVRADVTEPRALAALRTALRAAATQLPR